ncbi:MULTISPECIES: hypothetical protein [Xanthomonas]|uniref:hypothetical protein n=1 Tax=Xanthomonas TaxID=338 RepID=UPI00224DF805|nr:MULTISPECIES: hypothetical protein [Xanthomonas]MDY4283584.1 hypothetical protein [Xanthomonas sp. LF06-19]MDY4296661.1 hypothetical protein [Xanthomonas sp. LF02-5]
MRARPCASEPSPVALGRSAVPAGGAAASVAEAGLLAPGAAALDLDGAAGLADAGPFVDGAADAGVVFFAALAARVPPAGVLRAVAVGLAADLAGALAGALPGVDVEDVTGALGVRPLLRPRGCLLAIALLHAWGNAWGTAA